MTVPGSPRSPVILVLEPDPDLSSALFAELQLRCRRTEQTSGTELSSLPGHRKIASTTCRSVPRNQVMSLLETAEVAGIVLDLQRQARDALILLRLLQQRTRVPPLIAVGDESAMSIIGVLLEAGCTALLTEKPVDIQLADWYERVVTQN